MSIKHIYQQIERTDPTMLENMQDRRSAIKAFSQFAGKVAIASLPLAIGSFFRKAYGQTTSSILDVLNYALTLEYLEAEYYTQGVAAGGLIAAEEVSGFTQIRDHEVAHVNFLKAAIAGAGGTAVSKPTFDFTAGGSFSNVFTNYDTFLAVSQAFEDTGVRAYKGQAANLMSNKDVLTAALNIHSVEARHASYVRAVRRKRGASIQGWINGKDTGGIPAIQAIYNGEEITKQADIEITNINGFTINAGAASAAFDEPLGTMEVLDIVKPFLK